MSQVIVRNKTHNELLGTIEKIVYSPVIGRQYKVKLENQRWIYCSADELEPI